MPILVRREQEKYLFRLKTAVNYDTIRRQAVRSQQLTYEIVYTCTDVISSKEDTTKNTKHLSAA